MHVHMMVSVLLHHRDFVQTDILDGGPHNRQATGLCREDIDLIGTLPHIAEQTFNGIRALKMSVNRLRKPIKRQQVLFILSQAAHRFPDSVQCTWL